MPLKSTYSKSFLKSLAIAIPSVTLPFSNSLYSRGPEEKTKEDKAKDKPRNEATLELAKDVKNTNPRDITNASSSSEGEGSGGPSAGTSTPTVGDIEEDEEKKIKGRIQYLINLLEKISTGMGNNTHLLLPNGKSANLKDLAENKNKEILNFYFRGYEGDSGGSGLLEDSWGGKKVEWTKGHGWKRINDLVEDKWNGTHPNYDPLGEMFIKSLEEGVNFRFEPSGYLGCYQKDIDFFTKKTGKGCEGNQRYRMILKEIYETKGKLELLPRVLIGDYSGIYDKWLINLMDRDGQNLYFSEGAKWGARRLSMDDRDKEYIFEFRTALAHMKYRILKKVFSNGENREKLNEAETLWNSIKSGGYLKSWLSKYSDKLNKMEEIVDSLKKIKASR